MGPLLLSRVLELNDVQEGVLTLVFKVCDDNGLLLLDLKICVQPCSTSATTRNSSPLHTATSRRRASARSSAGCSRSSSRAPTSSSASRR
jgi:hypothetical protein